MGWEEALLDASFRGAKFDCVRTRDAAQHDVARFKYPYLDGEDTDDLGRGARDISITAVFFGDDYELRMRVFVKVLDARGPGELIHPVFGSIKVQVLDYDVEHDAESPDAATVTVRMIETATSNPFFVKELPVQKAAAASQLSGIASLKGIDLFSTAMAGIKAVKGGLSSLTSLRSVMTGTLGGLRNMVTGFIGTTLDLIDFPRAFSADLTGMLTNMVDLRSFDVGVISSDWKSVVNQLDYVVRLPTDVASGTVTPYGDSGVGSGSSLAATKPIPADPVHVATVDAVVKLAVATTLADVAATVLQAEADEPTLSPLDIEAINNDVRDHIELAIDATRDLYPVDQARPVIQALRDTAAAVQDAAIAVVDARPPLGQRVVEVSGNLHLVAYRWYGDYTRATELLRLNPKLRNPNNIQAGDVLFAYAK